MISAVQVFGSTAPVQAAPATSITVQGTSLVDASGNTVRLKGLNRSDTEYMCQFGQVFSNPADQASVNVMKSWGINFVRVPLNELCWLDNKIGNQNAAGKNYRDAITNYINMLNANGIYTAVDLHFSDPQNDGWAEQRMFMANPINSVPFWSSVATTFKNNHAMMFELFNEPREVSWACLRDGCQTYEGYKVVGMQTLVDTIRATGSTAPVIVNGLDWGHDMRSFLQYLPTDPAGQMVAGQHLYDFKRCRDTNCWNSEFKPVINKMPLVATEVGQQGCENPFVVGFLNWMAANGGDGVGVWGFGPGPCPASSQYDAAALITDWNGTPTTPYGQGVKNWFLNDSGTGPSVPTTQPPATTTSTTSTTLPKPTTSTTQAPGTTTTTTRPNPTTTTTKPPSSGDQSVGGYRMVASNGTVYGFGDQKELYGNAPAGVQIVSIANTKDAKGYWLAAADGRVFAFGNARHYGDMGGKPLNGQIVSMSLTASGNGYYLLGSDGGVFTYGDAEFFGSTGSKHLNAPALAITPNRAGTGYWFVASDGGVFTFGDAGFYGSMGGKPLNKPVVGMAVNPVREGYWLVASDGGIFTFGPDNGYFGSMGGKPLNAPIVDMSPALDGMGYTMVATDGGVFNFNTGFVGSLGGQPISSPIRDITN